MKVATNKRIDAKNIANGVLDYYLFSPIGVDPNTGDGISGQHFADDLEFIQNFMKDDVKGINVRINSGGGSIVDGLSIISAIRNCSIPVDTYIDGIGASIAGVIAMSGRKRFMNDYSRIMIHDPHLENDDNLTDADKNVLKNFKDVLITIFKNNSNYTTEQIDQIMTAETWFTATQSLSAGLIDSIVKTERNIGLLANDSKSVYLFANAIHERKTKPTMKKIFAKLTELKMFKNNETETDNDAIEKTAVETIESLSADKEKLANEKAELETKIAEKDAKIAELTAGVANATDANAETAVDNAIRDGKIEVAKRAEMLVVAKKDLNAFNTIVAGIAKKAVKVTNVIKDNAGKEIAEQDGTINGKTLRELEKSDSKLVAKIKNEQPDVYAKLYLKQYGVEFKQ